MLKSTEAPRGLLRGIIAKFFPILRSCSTATAEDGRSRIPPFAPQFCGASEGLFSPQCCGENKKQWPLFFLLFLFFDALSLAVYFTPLFQKIIFLLIVIGVAILTFYKLEYGLLLIFAELFVGSKGYLFFFKQDDIFISLRIALFLIFASIFFARLIVRRDTNFIQQRISYSLARVYALFWLVILFGIGMGLYRGNGFGAVFLDANGYFYIFLMLPIFYIAATRETTPSLGGLGIKLLYSATAWLSIKTLITFFIFTYVNTQSITQNFYLWIRNTSGEITPLGENFFRVFSQSQLFIVLALFLIAFSIRKYDAVTQRTPLYALGGLYGAALLLSFSRSFWFGIGMTVLVFFIYTIAKRNWSAAKEYAKIFGILGSISVLFVGIIAAPALLRIGERAVNFIGEPAASSRIAQFMPLVNGIIKNPVFGSGFGTTITYKSADPRIVAAYPSGEYSTYAFELGFLDMLLKIGFVGVGIYLTLIWKIVKMVFAFPQSRPLFFGLLALLFINIFSPYLNHPLGIGYILFMMLYGPTIKED